MHTTRAPEVEGLWERSSSREARRKERKRAK